MHLRFVFALSALAQLTDLLGTHLVGLPIAGCYAETLLGIIAKSTVLFTGSSGTTRQVRLATTIVALDAKWHHGKARRSVPHNHLRPRNSLRRCHKLYPYETISAVDLLQVAGICA